MQRIEPAATLSQDFHLQCCCFVGGIANLGSCHVNLGFKFESVNHLMKNKLLIIIGLLAIVAALVVLIQSREKTKTPPDLSEALFAPASPAPAHSHTTRVPAFQQPEETRSLAPTLSPAGFIGKTKEAYEVAKKIPQTLAQLPCYCECDRGYGHKSLHTCFTDDHASHCAVCVDEALLAYQLQTKDKLTPEQIRDRIVAQYAGADHTH